FQAEDGIRAFHVTGVQTCALPISAGARSAGYILVRLPLELKELFEGWLDAHYPLKKQRVLSLIRDTRGGALYEATWGTRMRGTEIGRASCREGAAHSVAAVSSQRQ